MEQTKNDDVFFAEKKIEEAYINSLEYKNLIAIVDAIKKDNECQKYISQLKDLQKLCRSKETTLEEKRKIVKQINEIKDKLHSTPLWTNYLCSKKEYEDMVFNIENILNNLS